MGLLLLVNEGDLPSATHCAPNHPHRQPFFPHYFPKHPHELLPHLPITGFPTEDSGPTYRSGGRVPFL